METDDARLKACQSLGFASQTELFQFIAAGAKGSPDVLLQKGLNAKNLTAMGYHGAGMARIGYSGEALKKLGYALQANGTPEPSGAPEEQGNGGAARVTTEGTLVPTSLHPGKEGKK